MQLRYGMADMKDALDDDSADSKRADKTHEGRIKADMANLAREFGGQEQPPFGGWYKGKYTDGETVRFNREVVDKYTWGGLEAALYAMGENYSGASMYKFTYEGGEKNKVARVKLQRLALALRYIKESDLKTGVAFFSKYNFEDVRNVAEAACNLIDDDGMRKLMVDIDQIGYNDDLVRSYAVLAIKWAIKDREDAN